ncbi:MAG TPA: alpha/beta fold hydrolase [Terriglobales bacterium]
MRIQFHVVVLGLMLCGTLGFSADEAHFPNNEDMRHFRTMDSPRLSPDGQQVLIHITDDTAKGGRGHLWLADVNGKPCRQLTYSPSGGDKNTKYRGEGVAEWMPDGESILFLSHRGEQTQLFRLPMNGGEPGAFDLKVVPPVDASKSPDALPPQEKAKVEKAQGTPEPLPIDVSGFQIAPDGKTIAIWAKDPQTPGEKHQQEEKADAVFVDHEQHGTRLSLLDPATSKLTAVAVTPDVQRVAWSPQSDRLLVEVDAPNSASDLSPSLTTWLVLSSDPQHPTKLALPATAHNVTWALDSKTIFYMAQAEMDAPPGYADLFQFSFADNKSRNLSNGFQGSVGFGTPIAEGGGTVLQSAENGVQLGVTRFGLTKPEPIAIAGSVIHQLNTNERRSGWVYLANGSTQADTLYYSSTLGAAGRALPTPPLFTEKLQASASQLVRWNSDGKQIEGLLNLPPQTSSQKVPLVLLIHGGPTGAFQDSYTAFVNFLVGRGWAVLRPNPRGSTGHGAEFAAANKNDLGGGDYRDIMTGLDAVLKQYPVDPDRLALIGYSYGGEMAGFMEGKTKRFKAIVSGAPVIDQFSEYGTEGDSWYDRWFFGKPWEHFADAWKQSPLSSMGHASTPFLLLQGSEDSVDPAGQSREMYRALRQMGVPVELVEYPREDHGPLATGIFGAPSPEPWHGFDARQRIVQFIEKGVAKKVH